jgi:hypothetical protein
MNRIAGILLLFCGGLAIITQRTGKGSGGQEVYGTQAQIVGVLMCAFGLLFLFGKNKKSDGS